MTPSLFLGLCLPEQIEHNPMHPILNLNIMVELPLGVTMGSKATNKREGRQQGKRKFATIPSTILRCKCCHMIMALEFFNSKRLCAARF